MTSDKPRFYFNVGSELCCAIFLTVEPVSGLIRHTSIIFLCLLSLSLSVPPGVLGIKVQIMLPHDPTGKMGPRKPLPDQVSVMEPKEEQEYTDPYSEQKGTKQGYEQTQQVQ